MPFECLRILILLYKHNTTDQKYSKTAPVHTGAIYNYTPLKSNQTSINHDYRQNTYITASLETAQTTNEGKDILRHDLIFHDDKYYPVNYK